MIHLSAYLAQNKSTVKSEKLLELSGKLWFSVATIGQWLFGVYVVAFYHTSAVVGDLEKWNRVLPNGYVPGDWIGNLSVAIHVLLGGIIIIGGPLQFVPIIQRKFREFHRWLGRIYVFTAIIVGIAGLVMVWVRGSVGDLFMHISISISAVYLIAFAALTIKNAMKRKFMLHRKMALRLFMIANGGWFFRIGLMGWLLVNGGPVGIDVKTFSGPFLWVLSALSYSFPISLILLELYFYAQEQKKQSLNIIVASLIFLATILTALGVFAATFISWMPRILD